MNGTELRGSIIEIRPKALYRIRLEDGRVITANIEKSFRHAVIRLIEGQRVLIRISPHDPHRGQIVGLAQ